MDTINETMKDIKISLVIQKINKSNIKFNENYIQDKELLIQYNRYKSASECIYIFLFFHEFLYLGSMVLESNSIIKYNCRDFEFSCFFVLFFLGLLLYI